MKHTSATLIPYEYILSEVDLLTDLNTYTALTSHNVRVLFFLQGQLSDFCISQQRHLIMKTSVGAARV